MKMEIRLPDSIRCFSDTEIALTNGICGDVSVTAAERNGNLTVSLRAETTPVRYLRLRWNFTDTERYPAGVRILGDAWERGYGDMAWDTIRPEKCMPWYFFASSQEARITVCFGVMVRPAAMAFWQTDSAGVTLWLDVRCGGGGVLLGGRTLAVCTVLFRSYEGISAFQAAENFCAAMCPDPILPEEPVYGSNNWYYAYGNSSHEEIIEDTKLVAAYTEGLENRPFMVIDDGWQTYPCDGPWDAGNAKFPDMRQLAEEIHAMDVKPGIWVRYLSDGRNMFCPRNSEMRLARDAAYLDPSHPS